MTEEQKGEGFEWAEAQPHVDSEVVQTRRTLGGNAGVYCLPGQEEVQKGIVRWRLKMGSESQWSKEYMCV